MSEESNSNNIMSREEYQNYKFNEYARQLKEKYSIDILDLPDGKGKNVYVYLHNSYVLVGYKLISYYEPIGSVLEEEKAEKAMKYLLKKFDKGLLKGFMFWSQWNIFVRKFQTQVTAEEVALFLTWCFESRNWHAIFESLNCDLVQKIPFWIGWEGDIGFLLKYLYDNYDLFENNKEEFYKLKEKIELLISEFESLNEEITSTFIKLWVRKYRK